MLQQILQPYLQALDENMRQIVQDRLSDEPGFGVMIRYALGWVDTSDKPYDAVTGKRLRPALLLLINDASGGDWQKALPAASAVELLHNFSLIHDDIQDNSEIRHGRPSVWQVWGMANAINAGDALFSLSYSALESLSAGVNAEQMLEVWRIFNRTNIELTRGQHLDMHFEQQVLVSIESYISMISGKSAALLAACAEMGSLIAANNREQAQRFSDFGLNIGIAFQIHDDILGIWGDPQITGKSAATDIIARKKSLPILYALPKSKELAAIYAQQEISLVDIQESVNILEGLGARTYTQDMEKIYYERSLQSLARINLSDKSRQQIQTFVDFLFQREY